MCLRNRQRGFSLAEAIVVIVVLGIVGGVLAGFIFQATEAYRDVRARSELVARARVALDRLAREIHHAVPNSIEVLAGGSGVQFVTARTGGRLVHVTEDFGTAFRRTSRRFVARLPRSALYSAGTGKPLGAGDILVIGNASPADLKAGTTRVGLTGTEALVPADGVTDAQIMRFPAKRFPYESPGRHYQIVGYTHEVGLAAGALHWHRAPGLAGYDSTPGWSAADPVLVDGVAAVSFRYFPGSPESGGILSVSLQLQEDGERITLLREIHVRNTP